MSDTERLHDELDLDADAALLVDTLSPAEAGRLSALLHDARAAEAADVAEGLDAIVATVPAFARAQIRRVLGDGR